MRIEERISSIIAHIDTIEQYCRDCGISDLDSFLSNPMAMDACITHMGHIGEHIGRIVAIDPEYFDRYDGISPAEIIGMRNRLFHDYEGIINDVVWEVIAEDLPEMKKQLLDN